MADPRMYPQGTTPVVQADIETAPATTKLVEVFTPGTNERKFVTLANLATAQVGIAGVAAGYKVARGETALDGTNPTPVATGLTTVIAFTATLKGTAAPGVSTSVLTANISGATVNVYAWKITGVGDATLIASTGTESFYWSAVGT